jgi:hypothetical protein
MKQETKRKIQDLTFLMAITDSQTVRLRINQIIEILKELAEDE